jgi:hypothetical protein
LFEENPEDGKDFVYLPNDRKSNVVKARERKTWKRNQKLTNVFCRVKDKYVKWEMSLDELFGEDVSVEITDHVTRWIGCPSMDRIPVKPDDFVYTYARDGYKLWLDFFLLQPIDPPLFFLVANQSELVSK